VNVGEGGTRRCRTRANQRRSYAAARGHLRSFTIASSTLQFTAPCRALLQTSGRLPLRRRSSPQSERTASSPLALHCCLLVCSAGVRAIRPRANDAPALLLTGFFGLSMRTTAPRHATTNAYLLTDRSLANLPLVGAPASIAFGYALREYRLSSYSQLQVRRGIHDLRSRRLRLVS
jgi:hypothetical protein